MADPVRKKDDDVRAPDRPVPADRDRISEAGRKWLEDNAEAMAEWRAWVDKNGTPLEHLRPF